jgi:hypothetical protein
MRRLLRAASTDSPTEIEDMPMTDPARLLQRFAAYAAAFEETYTDDNWNRLDEFLAPDLTYRVLGSPGFDSTVHGREAVYRSIRGFLDAFDRRCVRRVGIGDAPPLVENDTVVVSGFAGYRRGESDELILNMLLMAEFENDRIAVLSDVYLASTAHRMNAWMERWGKDLIPAY